MHNLERQARKYIALLQTCRTFARQRSFSGQASDALLLSRYQDLLRRGLLQPDANQEECVRKLAHLVSALADYGHCASAHREQVAAHAVRRAAARPQMLQEEEARLNAEEEHSSGPTAHASQAAAMVAAGQGGSGFFGWAWALAFPTQSLPHATAHPQPSHQQPGGGSVSGHRARAALLHSRVERRLDQLFGPPPPPPSAPRGLYIWGSVGSGKTLLMDLFFGVAAEHAGLQHARRLHFNAGLLELHSRMHAVERDWAARTARQMEDYSTAIARNHHHHQQQAQAHLQEQFGWEAGGGAGPGGASLSEWRQSVRDPIAEKLKRSSLAKMAFRRLARQRLSRSPEQHAAALAASNAEVIRHAARALVRQTDTLRVVQAADGSGRDGVVGAGHGEGGGEAGHISALLCFDEMQVGRRGGWGGHVGVRGLGLTG
jgi:hypothetical protein